MKRLLLVCFLLTAGCTFTFVQHATAQAAAPSAPVTQAAFTAKVNQMDTYIAAGNTASAQSTWNDIHQMLLSVMATTKSSIRSAATDAERTSFMTIMNNQRILYAAIWDLKTDLTTNRVAIHNKLGQFGLTIY